MQIQYTLASGRTVEVEVTDAQAEVIVRTIRKSENNDTKFKLRKARETSLDYITDEYGWEQPDGTVDIVRDFERAEEAEQVREAVATLNAKQRELVRLYFYEEKTVREIAAIFGINHSNVVRQIEVIKKALKKLL
jgi:RNA polymerase sigma factor (sigma-70 family)